MKIVDLHSHTTASDGTYAPAESVRRAKEKGLSALGITDHDTVAGIKEAIAAGIECGIEIVPGIEISTIANGKEIHVLGYYVDTEDEVFLQELKSLRNVRNRRNEMIIENLQKLGIDISLEEITKRKKMEEGNIGRPHIAEVLIEKGVVSSLQEAFQFYLGKEGKAYANPPRISPEEAIDLVIRAGGVPVLAHPGLYQDNSLVERLIGYGLAGIEANHTDHTPEDVAYFTELGEKHQLIITAGSDFHGERNGSIFHGDLGTCTVDYEVVQRLKERAR
ncbi:MAG TPA: PHP domain-containing protein [Bacillota bacterium]|nr:PHP domain-containing protein [Bacillota bacterium]